MMMEAEPATKTKRKKKQKKRREDVDTESDDETIGRRLAEIEKKKGRRPADDKTMEIALGPDDDESSDENRPAGVPVPAPRPVLGQPHDYNPRTQFAPWVGHPPPSPSPVAQLPPFPSQLSQLTNDSTPTTTAPKKKSRKEKTEERNRLIAQQLPIALNLKFKDRDKIVLAEEYLDSGAKEHHGNYVVAKYLEVGSKERGTYMQIDLDMFSYKDVRKIASNFDCKNCSNASKFECRRRMAVRKTAGTKYDETDVANPFTGSSEKQANTACRLINTCFCPSLYPRFVKINDLKGKEDWDTLAGENNPLKQFWVDAAEHLNDPENNDELCVLLRSGEDEDERLHQLKESGELNLADFNQMTHKSCASLMKNLLRAKEKCVNKMSGRSGFHSTDLWDYLNPTNLLLGKKAMPRDPVYYLWIVEKEHPGVEGAFDVVMRANLTSNSEETPSDTAECKSGNQTASTSSLTDSTAKGKDNEKLLNTISQTASELREAREEASAQRQDLINIQKTKLEEERSRAQWKEYDDLGVRVVQLKKQIAEDGDTMLLNLAIRVRNVEKALNIPHERSIVKDYSEE